MSTSFFISPLSLFTVCTDIYVNHIKHRFTPIYQKATYVHVTTKISQKMSAFLQMANYF